MGLLLGFSYQTFMHNTCTGLCLPNICTRGSRSATIYQPNWALTAKHAALDASCPGKNVWEGSFYNRAGKRNIWCKSTLCSDGGICYEILKARDEDSGFQNDHFDFSNLCTVNSRCMDLDINTFYVMFPPYSTAMNLKWKDQDVIKYRPSALI